MNPYPKNNLLVALALLVVSVGFTDSVAGQTGFATGRNQGQGNWTSRSPQFKSKFYVVKSDLPRETSIGIARHMDLVFATYVDMFKGLKKWRPKQLGLFLFSNQEDYIETLQTQLGAVGTGSAGMCISRGDTVMLVAWQESSIERLKEVLQHEGFHQFARHLFPRLPTWANEGMAEVFGRGVVIGDKLILGEVGKIDKLQLTAVTQAKRFLRFREFFTMDQDRWNKSVQVGDGAAINYLQAWCLCHFFLYADDAKYQSRFLTFLSNLNEGTEYQQAFVRAFGVPRFEELEQKWQQYVNELPPTDYRETIRRMEFLSQGMLSLREADIYPTTLDDLEVELKKARFQWTSKLFDKERKLVATDSQSFKIPGAQVMKEPAVFRLVDTKGKPIPAAKPTASSGSQSSSRPTRRSLVPLVIETYKYHPREFSVRWKRVGRKYIPAFETR